MVEKASKRENYFINVKLPYYGKLKMHDENAKKIYVTLN